MFQDVLGPITKAKVFRLDPDRGVIQVIVRRGGQKTIEVIDLKPLLESRGGAFSVSPPKPSSSA